MNEYLPYRALWTAVIIKAFEDIKERAYSDSGESPSIVRSRAYCWINEIDPVYMRQERSFNWVCQMLGLDSLKLQKLSRSREGIEKVLSGKFY